MVNEKLNEIAEGDIDLMIELLEIFFSQETKAKEEMLELASSQDWQKLARVAHRFQPSTVYVGLTDISTKLRHLEDSITDGSDTEEAINGLFLSILEDLDKARTVLREYHLHLTKEREQKSKDK